MAEITRKEIDAILRNLDGHAPNWTKKLRLFVEGAYADMIAINSTIYAAGAPVGSKNYFRIREIAAKYERDAKEARK